MAKAQTKREKMHLSQMSTKVKKEVAKLSKASGLAQWVIVEQILAGSLGLKKDFNPKEWVKSL